MIILQFLLISEYPVKIEQTGYSANMTVWGLGINGNKNNITESVFLKFMYAADWTNRCGGNTIQSYFSWNQYRLITYADYSERSTKNFCSCYCNAGFGRCSFLWAVNI